MGAATALAAAAELLHEDMPPEKPEMTSIDVGALAHTVAEGFATRV